MKTAVYPWWDRETDDLGNPLRVDVRLAVQEIWSGAIRRAKSMLGDASDAAEVMEVSVQDISRYLDARKFALFSQSTSGMLMVAFRRRLGRRASKTWRLELSGSAMDMENLEASCRRWDGAIDLHLDGEKLQTYLSHENRRILMLRQAGYEWKEIGDLLGLECRVAKNRFHRGIKSALAKFQASG